MRKLGISILFLSLTFFTKAQSLDTLEYEGFLEWVRLYHPVAAQVEINLRMGDMEVRKARGGFDPLLYGNLDRKEFKETDYYNRQEAGVTIPTWMGVELMGTFERNSGEFLNPEANVPTDGLFAAGAAINVGQGLILDKRRAALRQAQIYQQSTEVQRIQFLNGLYVDATNSYWKWSMANENVQVLQEGVDLAQDRFEFVRRSFEQGDLPAIDTVEAYSNLLNRQYTLQAAQQMLFAAEQELNTFLWNEEGEPMFLNEQIAPEPLFDENLRVLDPIELRTLVINHPDLQVADYELESLDVERRLKAQEILPVVKLKYNFLTEDLGEFNSPFFENNYKWGVSVYTPLGWRKSRGAFELAKAKIDFKQNSRDLKELQLRAKLESEINSWDQLSLQVDTYSENLESLEFLLRGEMRRFEIGESSLFLVNSREVKVFDSRVTLNNLRMKQLVAYAKARFAAGLGFE
ncbi:TolC family protein [Algoriphagus sediminis]|uniref:TolC family protein n=1 Tax=Algoriphagus sediminis TaxID=3057113 RepID=A0ABT7YE85_9BACT|nr:TolC family protein [Algoriphagus sediminis]MDN3204509.1 TolC family protein [Algoriphagus sediminis]